MMQIHFIDNGLDSEWSSRLVANWKRKKKIEQRALTHDWRHFWSTVLVPNKMNGFFVSKWVTVSIWLVLNLLKCARSSFSYKRQRNERINLHGRRQRHRCRPEHFLANSIYHSNWVSVYYCSNNKNSFNQFIFEKFTEQEKQTFFYRSTRLCFLFPIRWRRRFLSFDFLDAKRLHAMRWDELSKYAVTHQQFPWHSKLLIFLWIHLSAVCTAFHSEKLTKYSRDSMKKWCFSNWVNEIEKKVKI